MTLDYGRVGVFIDGENILLTLYRLDWKIDYEKLLKWIVVKTNSKCLASFFYLREDNYPSEEKKRFILMLNLLGFKVINVKPKIKTNSDGYICNADPFIITDMISLVLLNKIHTVVLLSGDGDFSYPLENIQNYGARVFVLSSINCTHKEYIANNQKIPFIDINDIRDEIELKFY